MGSFNSKVASIKDQTAIYASKTNAKNVRERKEHGGSVENEEKCPRSDEDSCAPNHSSKTPEKLSSSDKFQHQSRSVLKRSSNVPEYRWLVSSQISQDEETMKSESTASSNPKPSWRNSLRNCPKDEGSTTLLKPLFTAYPLMPGMRKNTTDKESTVPLGCVSHSEKRVRQEGVPAGANTLMCFTAASRPVGFGVDKSYSYNLSKHSTSQRK